MTKRFFGAAVWGGLVLTLALFLGGCENPAGDNGSNAAQEAADDFKSDQSAVLGKTADTVDLGDEAAVDAALAAYEELSDGAQELLAAEKAKLDGLKAKITELKAAATAEELAEAFRTGHSAVLEKEAVTLADEEAVDAALAAYETLSAGAQALLAEEKAKLDGFKARIDELKAAAFRTGYAAILGKTVENIALGDEAAVNAALAVYEVLSDGVKELLTGEKEKLDVLKAKIDELKPPRFSTVAALQTWLTGKPANDSSAPYAVAYTGDETPAEIYGALDAGGKYVALDLSTSSVEGFTTGTEAGREKIVELTLPDTLTEIPSGSTINPTFKNFTGLKVIHAAKAVTVGTAAFYGLASLTTVDFPEAVTLKGNTFSYCTALQTISLLKATTLAGRNFVGCTGLETVYLPVAASISTSAFNECEKLTTLTLGDVPPTIGTRIFARVAISTKTITIKVPGNKLADYRAAVIQTSPSKTWADVTNKTNTDAEYFWDLDTATKDNLTVRLEAIE